MASAKATGPRTGPLHDAHVELGAKFGDFGGWLMPLEYAGGGVLAEHMAVRTAVGAFDVSHMGTLTVRGLGAKDALNAVLTNDLNRIGNGDAQYSLLCSEDGGVVDDLLVYQRAQDELLLVPNAANTAQVLAVLGAELVRSPGIVVQDLSSATAILAIQGPRSVDVIADLGLPTDLDYMTFVDLDTGAESAVLARSGYTGERGYELLVSSTAAETWWEQIIASCRDQDGLPCGLGARDTLRTEMGYPLHGHELSAEITPVQAGASWAVGWDKPAFRGRVALQAERANGPTRRIRGLRLLERGIPRPGMEVRRAAEDERPVGLVTSGTFSPSLRYGIALALLADTVELGDEVVINVRDRSCRAEVVHPPFVDCNPKG